MHGHVHKTGITLTAAAAAATTATATAMHAELPQEVTGSCQLPRPERIHRRAVHNVYCR